jgi:hypothetical protein
VALLMLSGIGYAQNTSTIAGGPHDLSTGSALRNTNTTINTQTCVFCHVPHGGSNTIPLWNRATPTTSYQPYSSSTSSVTATSAAIQASLSGACLSCHDGTIAMDVLTNVNGVAFGTAPTGGSVSFTKQGSAKSTYGNGTGGTNNVMTGGLPFLGSDLRNDHPVAIVYQTAYTADTTHYTAVTTSGAKIYISGGVNGNLPLYGGTAASATVECSSCHDAHNNSVNGTNGGFLRVSNAGSKMCTTCHIK